MAIDNVIKMRNWLIRRLAGGKKGESRTVYLNGEFRIYFVAEKERITSKEDSIGLYVSSNDQSSNMQMTPEEAVQIGLGLLKRGITDLETRCEEVSNPSPVAVK